MKPENLKTKIFLDGGDPKETGEILELLGFLDGQTTNPSLFAKNPEVQARLSQGERFSKEEVYNQYQDVIKGISALLPGKSVSVEVYADKNTPSDEILRQAREMNAWVPNAHIKLPITSEALKAAKILVQEGVNLNITLVFSQEQAAAVYAATIGAKKGQVYLSPFVGRLDDIGINGMSLIENIVKMYRGGDGHVEVLSASVRNINHFLGSIKFEADIITVPGKILRLWKDGGLVVPEKDWEYDKGNLTDLPYVELDLNKNWEDFNIQHDLTDKGLEKFVSDWNSLIK